MEGIGALGVVGIWTGKSCNTLIQRNKIHNVAVRDFSCSFPINVVILRCFRHLEVVEYLIGVRFVILSALDNILFTVQVF